MLEQFRQQAKRRGLKCVEIDIPLHPEDDQEVRGPYFKRTRAVTGK